MILYEQALQIIRDVATPREPKTTTLEHLRGTVTSQTVYSPISVPSFRNSAMDGYAVCAADIAHATDERPVTLDMHHSVAAGDKPSSGKQGTTCEITTGAPVPQPYDAVIQVEHVKTNGNATGQILSVQFSRSAKSNANIRQPGEDFQQGQAIIPPGVRLNAGHMMALAALGIPALSIRSAPLISIFSTGNEITDQYGTSLEEGKIFNSNSPYLMARAAEEGYSATYGGIIADKLPLFHQALDAVPAGSVIITTGAVSKGRWDFIPEALNQRGATIHFHRVSIRPGKPVLFATLKDGSFFFGLPGNPISTAIGFQFFVVPLICSLCACAPETPLSAQLDSAYSKKVPLRQFLKARLRVGQDGILRATIPSEQESFKINPMTTCNAWIIVEEDRMELKQGDIVSVMPFSRQLVL